MNSTFSVASHLQPSHRQEIAVKVLSQQEPITQIAQEKQVSRKFVYQLMDELFQGSRPVLTGVDAESTYCFLLEAVEHHSPF